MYNPQISVIIPCYNVSKYLGRCMDSIVNQTIGIENLQVILINDASSDETWDIICDYRKRYSEQILAVNLEENMRQGGARNVGLSLASCEYITFVDSDDWIELDMYENMLEKMKEYQCDVVFCRNVRDNGKTTIFEKETGKQDKFLVIDSNEKRSEFIAANLIGVGVWDKLYRRGIIYDNDIHFIEHKAYEDICWGALINLYVKRVYMIEERLYHYFVNDVSTVLKKNESYHLDIFEVNLIKWEEYLKRGALKRYPEAIKYDFLLSYYIAGIKMLALRFDHIPYEVFYMMQENIKKLIPDYKENKYIKRDLDELYRLLFQLIDVSLSEEEIDEVCNVIRKTGL